MSFDADTRGLAQRERLVLQGMSVGEWERDRQQRFDCLCRSLSDVNRAARSLPRRTANSPVARISELLAEARGMLRAEIMSVGAEQNPFTKAGS